MCSASILFAAFVFDAALFRSGLYSSVVSPVSTAGSVQRVIQAERERPSTFPRRIVVLGDSQLAEGFSAKVANRTLEPARIGVAHMAISGSTPRDWFYVLRDLDPNRTAYNVIALPLRDYTDLDDLEDLAGRLDDLNYLTGSLRMTDVFTFAASYPTWEGRWTVFRDSLLKGLAYRRDLRDFLHAPKARRDMVSAYREHAWDWGYHYPGNPNSLAGLTYDATTGTVTFPPGVAVDNQQGIRNRLTTTIWAVRGNQRVYLKRWLQAIESLYRGKDVRFVIYRMPQYPIHRALPAPPIEDEQTTVHLLRRDPKNVVIDEHRFDFIERPDYYFDGLHLNAQGRRVFSAAFAREMLKALERFSGSQATR